MAQISKNIDVQQQEDLKKVEDCLRNLYHTQVGQPCQYLLTSAYQKWLVQVKTYLHQHRGNTETQMETIDIYLPNYHIVFLHNKVQIDFIRPHLYKHKRKREND